MANGGGGWVGAQSSKAINGILMWSGCPKPHKPDWLCVFPLSGNSHRETEAGMGFGLSAVRHL